MADISTQSVYIAGDISYVTGTVNGVSCTWTLTGDHIWSTTAAAASDGVYTIALTAIDTAGNQLDVTTTAYEGLHLKTDWTADDYYNADDFNRVGAAVAYIAGQLQEAGYECSVDPNTSWTSESFPGVTPMGKYLDQVRIVKAAFYGKGVLPESMAYPTAEDANEIERLLEEIETYYLRMLSGMIVRCGVTMTGGIL